MSTRLQHQLSTSDERTLILINPLAYRCRREYSRTIEAAADRTGLDFGPVKTAMLVRLDVWWIKPVGIKADHRYQVQSIAEVGPIVEWGATRNYAVPSPA